MVALISWVSQETEEGVGKREYQFQLLLPHGIQVEDADHAYHSLRCLCKRLRTFVGTCSRGCHEAIAEFISPGVDTFTDDNLKPFHCCTVIGQVMARRHSLKWRGKPIAHM